MGALADIRRGHRPDAGVIRGQAHSPALRCSPSAASRSRSPAASCGGSPGMVASVPADGGVQLDRGHAQRAVERAGGDVDQLHPPVRDHHQAAEHDAAGHEQVVGALRVAEGAHPSSDQPVRPDPHADPDGGHADGHRRAVAVRQEDRDDESHQDQRDPEGEPGDPPCGRQAGGHRMPRLTRRGEGSVDGGTLCHGPSVGEHRVRGSSPGRGSPLTEWRPERRGSGLISIDEVIEWGPIRVLLIETGPIALRRAQRRGDAGASYPERRDDGERGVLWPIVATRDRAPAGAARAPTTRPSTGCHRCA